MATSNFKDDTQRLSVARQDAREAYRKPGRQAHYERWYGSPSTSTRHVQCRGRRNSIDEVARHADGEEAASLFEPEEEERRSIPP